jgi:LPS sulfotransferase NodH
MRSDLRIVLFAHPRSGSSSLCRILDLHPEVRMLEEPFHEQFASWTPGAKNYRDHVVDAASLDAQLDEIFQSYNGLKVHDYQLPPALAVRLLQRPDCTIIFLRRRNLLQSVVSVQLALQTRLWKTWDMTEPLAEYYRDLAPLDLDDIQRHMVGLKEQMDFFAAALEQRPDGRAISLSYEELYFAPPAQREERLRALWHALGLDPLDPALAQQYLRPEQARLNSPATYALLPNADEIQRRCGSDETGWLYD